MINNAQRRAAYRKLGEDLVALYGSVEFDLKMRKILNELNYSDEVTIFIGDYILGFYTKDELVRDLSEYFSYPQEKVLLLLDRLSPELVFHSEENGFKISPVEQNDTFKLGVLGANSTSPIRTMQTDMDKVHGYGAYREMYPDERMTAHEDEVTHSSSQDDTLARPKLAEMPTYSEGE